MPQTNLSRRSFVAALATSALAACSNSSSEPSSPETPSTPENPKPSEQENSLELNMNAWNYDEEDDVWWQKGVVYCTKPAAEEYESLAIYVPGPYLTGTPNDSGTYTCEPNANGARGKYTASTAPVLIPINGGLYAGELSAASYNYSGLEPYLETGFIYVYPGFRGRSNAYAADGSLAYEGAAPWSVVDLKAAVRFLRYNAELLPGDYQRVFAFGLGAGGTHANLLGASGDAEFFEPYLTKIGAALKTKSGVALSDAIQGCASWVPEVELKSADAAYEWMLGQYVQGGSEAKTRAEGTWTCELSRDLARLWATTVNASGLTNGADMALNIDESEGGICCAGTYYQLLCDQLEAALNSFISTTRFPYAEGAVEYLEDADFAGGDASSRASRAASDQAAFGTSSTYAINTYASPADYVAALDAGIGWLSYDAEKKIAKVHSLAGYAVTIANPERDASGYDTPDLSSPENLVFGTRGKDSAHYSRQVGDLVASQAEKYAYYAGWSDEYPKAWADDLLVEDSVGKLPEERLEATDPLHYLSPARPGFQTSTVAPHWRVQFGTHQGVTPLTMYVDLIMALRDCGQGVQVTNELVWGQGHALAESSGNAVANLLGWIEEIQ